MSEYTTSVFPKAMGTEEETRPYVFEGLGQISPEASNVAEIRDVIESRICDTAGVIKPKTGWLRNGAYVYKDAAGIEIASPECDSPETLALYIEADSEIIVDGLASYVQRRANRAKASYTAALPRRVIDSRGNTWGCHDNFSIQVDTDYDTYLRDTTNGQLDAWRLFYESRCFMTGAGLVTDAGLYLSQKLSVLNDAISYANKPILMRVDSSHGQRYESRANDVNLKEWARKVRLGGTALFLAASLSELGSELIEKLPDTTLSQRQGMNKISFNKQLELVGTEELSLAIKIQRIIWGSILADLPKRAKQPIPENLYSYIGESLRFCDDFEAVLKGDKDIAHLANRADWAQKLVYARAGVQRPRMGTSPRKEPRTLTGAYGQGVDRMYDLTTIEAAFNPYIDEARVNILRSFGSRLDRHHNKVADVMIADAKHTPPRGTRAAQRVAEALRHRDHLGIISWHCVNYTDSAGTNHNIPLEL